MSDSILPDPNKLVDPSLRAVNQDQNLANFANSVTAIYGISGSGKSSLTDTAVEYAWEQFHRTSLGYVTDLGGFGNKRISLIRLGILRIWDPRNHVNPFETMELISLGAFPESIDEPETGRAAPNVKLILPRRIITSLTCPQGHTVAKFDNDLLLNSAQVACPTCKIITSIANGTTEKILVRHRMFKSVGHRFFDSITEMNDWGMDELASMSVRGLLPMGKEGGNALGSADALRQGTVAYGTNSPPQFGFLQNRSYRWIANIRGIPDQVVPATCTFAVEQGKADDDSGGVPVLGMQIAGNARTAKAARWVGNCLHASREPNVEGNMVYRLWLTTHIDVRDVRRIPYLAKHRGIPLDMPDYLEDPWDADKAKRDAAAWTVCSMRVFYTSLQAQLAKLELLDRAKYPNAPALQPVTVEEQDEIMGVVAPLATLAVPVMGQVLAAGLRMPGAPAGLRMPSAPVIAAPPLPLMPLPMVAPVPSLVETLAAETTSIIAKQLEASLAAHASIAAAAPATSPVAAAIPVPPRRMPGALRMPGAPSTHTVSAAAPSPPVVPLASASSPGPPAPPARRTPRPPV